MFSHFLIVNVVWLELFVQKFKDLDPELDETVLTVHDRCFPVSIHQLNWDFAEY